VYARLDSLKDQMVFASLVAQDAPDALLWVVVRLVSHKLQTTTMVRALVELGFSITPWQMIYVCVRRAQCSATDAMTLSLVSLAKLDSNSVLTINASAQKKTLLTPEMTAFHVLVAVKFATPTPLAQNASLLLYFSKTTALPVVAKVTSLKVADASTVLPTAWAALQTTNVSFARMERFCQAVSVTLLVHLELSLTDRLSSVFPATVHAEHASIIQAHVQAVILEKDFCRQGATHRAVLKNAQLEHSLEMVSVKSAILGAQVVWDQLHFVLLVQLADFCLTVLAGISVQASWSTGHARILAHKDFSN
jgi:hypothetical protein